MGISSRLLGMLPRPSSSSGVRTADPSCSLKLVSHRGAGTRPGLFGCLVFGVGVTIRNAKHTS